MIQSSYLSPTCCYSFSGFPPQKTHLHHPPSTCPSPQPPPPLHLYWALPLCPPASPVFAYSCTAESLDFLYTPPARPSSFPARALPTTYLSFHHPFPRSAAVSCTSFLPSPPLFPKSSLCLLCNSDAAACSYVRVTLPVASLDMKVSCLTDSAAIGADRVNDYLGELHQNFAECDSC
jgi:hypothetical protein